MSYRFCFGASGSGKSTYLQKQVLSGAESLLSEIRGETASSGNVIFPSARSYLYLVPEQFNMQTQKHLVQLSRGHGIMNVDVLSFGRLSYRIFEETGTTDRAVLGDIGKSLILRKLSGEAKDRLSVLGGKIDRIGMIDEVKSILSEFMQYGLTVQEIEELSEYAENKGQKALSLRLRDLTVLYEEFLRFEKERYITGEETMELLAQAIPASKTIRDSVIVLDGFTGFTPVQYRVITALMQTAREVVISLTYGERQRQKLLDIMAMTSLPDEQDLFYLSEKTALDITKRALQCGVKHSADIFMEDGPNRFETSPSLLHLERSLFRYPIQQYEEEEKLPIELFCADDPKQEARAVCIRIRRMIQEKGYSYRDFGIVAGDLSVYKEEIKTAAALYDIPIYVDETRALLQNPMTEAICRVLEIAGGDLSYETVFGYLRSGLSLLSFDDVDRLENYCLAHGISSRKRFELPFSDQMEPVRERFLAEIMPILQLEKGSSARVRAKALYDFLVGVKCEQRMKIYAAHFAEVGDHASAKEYEQIYAAIGNLLDQLVEILDEEKLSAQEFLDLVKAGIGQIKLGVLPQEVDRVLVGDIERTRLSGIKVLFFVGANDGNVPKATSKGGIISDLDREFLLQAGKELAPTPRQEMYIQRLYLYMNLTKPSDGLVVSYAKMSGDGKSIRPSYLIGLLQQIFPGLVLQNQADTSIYENIVGEKDAQEYLAQMLREFSDGRYDDDPEELHAFLTLYGSLSMYSQYLRKEATDLSDAAFRRYDPKPISVETARRLYGTRIYGSVSRLEMAAQCYLRQFLHYGIRLQERREFQYTPADAGTILHNSIEKFGEALAKNDLKWTDFTNEQGKSLSSDSLKEIAGSYQDQLLYTNARNRYNLARMERVLHRTVETLQYQLLQGDFVPRQFEMSFGTNGEFRFALPDGKEAVLTGRIDRVDLCEQDGVCYVKIVDYKSGQMSLDEKRIRQGLQLQLMIYMDAVVEKEQGFHPDSHIEPAALLYYHFDDPILKNDNAVFDDMEDAKERHDRMVRRSLRPTGMVSNNEEALSHLDHSGESESSVIPLKRKKDGSPNQSSKTFSEEEFEELRASVRDLVVKISDHIISGGIEANPAVLNAQRTSCTFCEYQGYCGFDLKLPGCRYRELS